VSLREELAPKLRDLYFDGLGDGWNDVADECIRQMEWAAFKAEQQTRAELTGSPLFLGEDMSPAAPEGWKP
jgi:hypothetical protein